MPANRSRSEFDLEQALRILQKNSPYATVFALALVSMVAIVNFTMPDTYEPTPRLEIDPPARASRSDSRRNKPEG